MLGVVTAVQAAVLVALATANQNGPHHALVLGWGLGELMVVMALTGLASIGRFHAAKKERRRRGRVISTGGRSGTNAAPYLSRKPNLSTSEDAE